MLDGGDIQAVGMESCIMQHPLGPTPAKELYTHTRCFKISARTKAAGPLQDLSISIAAVHDEVPNLGTPRDLEPWRIAAKRLFRAEEFMLDGPRRTSLDFSIARPSRVVILLEGTFWRFSETLAPLTTKQDFSARYFDLRRHQRNAGGEIVDIQPDMECRLISFETVMPLLNGERHGFSLNIDLLIEVVNPNNNGLEILPLPITIDPDIENKGNG